MSERIPFNRPHLTGREFIYIGQAIEAEHLASDGRFTRDCSRLLEEALDVEKVLMTCSGTAALELALMLCDVGPGDEVILPSFTFVTTATAILRTGARPRFVDIDPDTLNVDPRCIAGAMTPATRVILPVHYSGVACDMKAIAEIADAHGLRIVEDAAHAVNAFLGDRALGSIGDLGCFSFHETKNYTAGEGGALCVNDPAMLERARIIRDKGTDRHRFELGLVDKYTWVDVGSSFAPSDLVCAFLKAQLEQMDSLLQRRLEIYAYYRECFAALEEEGFLRRPIVPEGCRHNAHGFFVLLPDRETRDALIAELDAVAIRSAFHYVPLHDSPMGRRLGLDAELPVTEAIAERLVRLPMFYELTRAQIERVADETGRILRTRGVRWASLP